MSNCKVCKEKLSQIIDFGLMPISNHFLSTKNEAEYKFHQSIAYCPSCHMVQLEECVDPASMFNQNYAFFSSTSNGMENHFKFLAEKIANIVKDEKSPLIIEIGCNDGIMLKHLAKRGLRHLGIEPSSNVAKMANANGVNTISKFFSIETAKQIQKDYGSASLISGSNVICHIEDINSVFQGVSKLLLDDGVFIFEEPYLLDIISKTSFDQIYDEHIYLFSCLSVSELARRHGLDLVDVELLDVHGGEARYYIKKIGRSKASKNVINQINLEKKLKLDSKEGYSNFARNVKEICTSLKKLLETLTAKGESIIAYGATSKSTTLLNFSGIDSSLIKCIYDNSPSKIGKFTPGTHIPVVDATLFKENLSKYTVLLAWNHKMEIFRKESDYRLRGGKFITFFPAVLVE